MRDINILKGEERMNHYLPLAQAILDGKEKKYNVDDVVQAIWDARRVTEK